MKVIKCFYVRLYKIYCSMNKTKYKGSFPNESEGEGETKKEIWLIFLFLFLLIILTLELLLCNFRFFLIRKVKLLVSTYNKNNESFELEKFKSALSNINLRKQFSRRQCTMVINVFNVA